MKSNTQEWQEKRIDQICDLGRGRVISQEDIERNKGTFPVFSSQSKDNGILGYLNTFDFEGDYVTWTTDGANAGTVFFRTGRFNCTNVCGTLKPTGPHTNANYLARALSCITKRHVSYIGNPKLMNNVMASITLRLPPRRDQDFIARILDTADALIAKSEAILAKLRQVRSGLLHDLLTRGLDAHGQLRDPAAHPEQFKDSPLGRIPREWEVRRLAEMCVHLGSGVTPRGGQDVYTTSGVMLIRSQNVHFDGLRLDDVAFITENTHLGMRRSEVYAHDVLYNITGASIGRCCAMPAGLGVANVNQHVCILRLPDSDSATAACLAAILSSSIGQRQLDALNTVGNRQGLNFQQLGSFLIPWPESADERVAIAAHLATHDRQIASEQATLSKLRQLKSGLMTDLLEGRVRAPEII
jgi:type I restriction enzyme S subunit